MLYCDFFLQKQIQLTKNQSFWQYFRSFILKKFAATFGVGKISPLKLNFSRFVLLFSKIHPTKKILDYICKDVCNSRCRNHWRTIW